MPAPAGDRHRSFPRAFKDFWGKAYEDNLTGLGGMVAYNLLLSLFPLALLALFIAGQVLESRDLEQSVLNDLQQIFPSATDATLNRALDRVRDSAAGFGVVALVASVWIGSSFWGALDTAFCQIYHVRCRSWWEQKRFSILMLLVVLLFMAATVAVPNRHVPWRAVWPGAMGATVAIGALDYAFPFYLGNVSTLARFGTTFVFVLIVLLWFYALAVVVLAGAVMNALRFEILENGEGTHEGAGASSEIPKVPD